MRPLETAVSAVSEPEKNAPNASKSAIGANVAKSSVSIVESRSWRKSGCHSAGHGASAARSARQYLTHQIERNVICDKGFSDAANEHKCQTAVSRLLVVRHVRKKFVGLWSGARDGGGPRLQTGS